MKTPDRILTGILFVLVACAPAGILGIYLFVANSECLTWLGNLEYAFSPENAERTFFIVLASSILFSSIAGGLLLSRQRSKLTLVTLFVGGIIQSLVYVSLFAWTLAGVSVIPLFWLAREYNRV
jgi:hypothetical protein